MESSRKARHGCLRMGSDNFDRDDLLVATIRKHLKQSRAIVRLDAVPWNCARESSRLNIGVDSI